jgi:hypothetical protein
MGCTSSKLQGDSFDDINADAKPTSNHKVKPSYSSQPGRRSGAPTSTAEPIDHPTDDAAGIVSRAEAPAGNWTADRERIRQDRAAYFSFKKQPTVKDKNPYGRQATTREEPPRRSPFVVL